MKPTTAAIDFDDGMRLRSGQGDVSVLLTRIVAQQLAERLMEVAGVRAASTVKLFPVRVLDFPDLELERKRAFDEGLRAGISAMQESKARQARKGR
jgi:hypothetical protein